jgi:hypothetical protein
MDAQILDNIGRIVELKRDMKGVGIGHEGQNSHEADRKKMLEGEGVTGTYRWRIG